MSVSIELVTFRDRQRSVVRGGEIGHDFEALWRDDGPTLWRAVYAFTAGRRDVTDDAVTEAFARALQHTETIREPLPWLYRTAFRIAARDLRDPPRDGVGPPDASSPETTIEIIDVLRVLPPSQRAALFLHYFADLPVQEIARLQGTTAAAVKVRLMRGRQRLRRLLSEEAVR
jgi:RNA polymerase sigma factor (sigma-70 family)